MKQIALIVFVALSYSAAHAITIPTVMVGNPGNADDPGRDVGGVAYTCQIGSSPIAAAGHIYVTDLQGSTIVVSSGELPRLVSLNHLSEPVSASAAIAGRQLFLRGEKHLYCLAETAGAGGQE